MARPTKEQVKKREEIKGLGLFVRDSEIYTYFENELSRLNITPTRTSYYFCMECEKRTDDFYYDSDILKKNNNDTYIDKLYDIDYKLGVYFHKLDTFSHSDFIAEDHYFSETYVLRAEIEKILNREISADCGNDLISLESVVLDDFTIVSREFFSNKDVLSETTYYSSCELFTKEEREKVKQHYKQLTHHPFDLQYLTLISKDNKCEVSNSGLERNTFAELDLTKPLEELVEFVTMLKKDYDKDPTSISNFHRLIGMELEDHKCSLEACEIYKHKNPKPLSGRLMDVLFIYDCGVAGLDDSYIMDEVNRYWHDIKNIHREKITKDTLQKYRKFAKDYIDNKEYKSFIKGYVLPI